MSFPSALHSLFDNTLGGESSSLLPDSRNGPPLVQHSPFKLVTETQIRATWFDSLLPKVPKESRILIQQAEFQCSLLYLCFGFTAEGNI